MWLTAVANIMLKGVEFTVRQPGSVSYESYALGQVASPSLPSLAIKVELITPTTHNSCGDKMRERKMPGI